MSAAAIWAVAGLALCGLEMLAPGAFLLWIGLGAIGAGAAAAGFGLGWHAQIGVFVGLTLALVLLIGMRRRRPVRTDLVNAPAAGLIGQSCRAIGFHDGEGRVALRDGTWAARISGGAQPTDGQTLKIVGLEGTTLLVAANG